MDLIDYYVIESYPFHLYVFTDEHLGSPLCYEEGLIKTIEIFNSDPIDKAFIGLGDKCALIDHKDKRWEGVYPGWLDVSRIIDSQIDRYIQLYEPIKDYGIILLEGGHENHIKRYMGVDPQKRICDSLGIPGKTHSAFIDLHLRQGGKTRDTLRIYAHHGYIVAKTEDTKSAILSRYIKHSVSFNADLYLYGHCHQLRYDDSVISVEKYRKTLRMKRKIFALCGGFEKAYSDTFSAYTERKGISFSDLGFMIFEITLNNNKVNIEIEKVRV